MCDTSKTVVALLLVLQYSALRFSRAERAATTQIREVGANHAGPD